MERFQNGQTCIAFLRRKVIRLPALSAGSPSYTMLNTEVSEMVYASVEGRPA